MNYDFVEIRNQSNSIVSALGYAIPKSLPLLEAGTIRDTAVVANRALALNCVVASAFGLDRKLSMEWVQREGLLTALTQGEILALETGNDLKTYKAAVEALWALAWSLCRIPDIRFDSPCKSDLVRVFPDLEKGAPSNEFCQSSRLRDARELYQTCDLAYCMHWALRDAELHHHKLQVTISITIVRERRRALEWILCDEKWDEISLDT